MTDMLIRRVLLIVAIPLLFALLFACDAVANSVEDIPMKGMVTMLDLGAKKCTPCRMMMPIMKKMEKVYRGKADIIFIDVWENRDQAKRFGIHAIPTQIFFNPEGKEVYRHMGFMSEKDIMTQMNKMGVK